MIAGSVEVSAEKVEGPGLRDATESVNDSREEELQPPDVAVTLSSLLAGLPTFAGSQRLASSLRQKFVHNSGEFLSTIYAPRSTLTPPSDLTFIMIKTRSYSLQRYEMLQLVHSGF